MGAGRLKTGIWSIRRGRLLHLDGINNWLSRLDSRYGDIVSNKRLRSHLLFRYVKINRQTDFVAYGCSREFRCNSKGGAADCCRGRKAGVRLVIHSRNRPAGTNDLQNDRPGYVMQGKIARNRKAVSVLCDTRADKRGGGKLRGMMMSGRGDVEDWCAQLAADLDSVVTQPYDLFTTMDLLSFYDKDNGPPALTQRAEDML